MEVNKYFDSNQISKYADSRMIFKSIIVSLMYFVPYALFVGGVISNPWVYVLCWAIMGVGMAGIGLNIMHDAIHGAYSSKPFLNKILGISMNIIGGNAYVWHMQHNVLHHTYPNIDDHDDDIDIPFLLRMSPHQARHWFHRYQQVYIWILYSFATLFWITTKDFAQLEKYRQRGLTTGKKYFIQLLNILLWKAFYYGYVLVIPLTLLDFHPAFTIGGFVLMHLIAGILLSVIFQPAHVFTGSEFIKQEEAEIDKSWTGYQLETTTNFKLRGFMNWIAGGLNYQVEHHLFPNICHVHYKNISPIVEALAKKYNLPYYVQPDHYSALHMHYDMVRTLGQPTSN